MQSDRDEQIKNYITLDAIASVISKMVMERDEDLMDDACSLSVSNGRGDNNAGLLNALWPDDDDLESFEYLLADVQSTALEARLLSLFASDESREWMIGEAARMAEFAGRFAARIAERLPADEGVAVGV